MIDKIISRYKRIRTEHYLAQKYRGQYAFVGMGQHSICNLYPVLQHLGVRLKYICVTSERKARLIEERFPGVRVTVFIDEILNDGDISGVFVCASPAAHFKLASKVLHSGKSLFIEKPVCSTLEELDMLIELQEINGSPVVMVGMQKRYAPALEVLRKRLEKESVTNYDLHYCTGAYPEGNALLDLYIHPLDMLTYLFGRAEIMAFRPVASNSYILMLSHGNTVGTVELSTDYVWTDAVESLAVRTGSGIYSLVDMESLQYRPFPVKLFSIPTEKIFSSRTVVETLYQSNRFTSASVNNQVFTQGYFNEIRAFLAAVEGKRSDIRSNLRMIRETYELLSDITVFS